MSDKSRGGTGALEPAVSRCMAGILKEYVGRGPTHARTYMRHNMVVCVMQQTLTKAELHVARDLGSRRVRGSRRDLQDGLRAEACEAVEELTGRRVISFLSDHDVDNDFLATLFVLADEDGDGSPDFHDGG